ncbi:MAG: ABC transporter permease [Planctomycetes bacterium]|nr:ABC transporter permease [Planctomycetota bacterium]
MRTLLLRSLRACATLLGLVAIAFVLLRLAPGDPAQLRFASDDAVDSGAAAEALVRFRSEHLLDRPLHVQFLHYLGPFDLSPAGHRLLGGSGSQPWGGLLAGDFGREYLRPDVEIAPEVLRRLSVTLPLALLSALLAYALALPLGVWQGLRRSSAFDRWSRALTLLAYCAPVFWVALLLQELLGPSGLDWLPILGLRSRTAPSGGWGDLAAHAVLPIVCLSYASIATISRQMRAATAEIASSDFVLAARARGVRERAVIWRHIVRNALVPATTMVGQVLPWLVGGSVIVETVFEIPGMGKYALESLQRREYDAVAACVIVTGVMTLAGLRLSDVLQSRLDPRVRDGAV